MTSSSEVDLQQVDNTEKTPVKKRRLPREWSGTKVAQERKKKLDAIRQRRRRARIKAEKARAKLLADDSSGEDVPEEEQVQGDVLDNLEPGGGVVDSGEEDDGNFEALDPYPGGQEIDRAERRRAYAEELLAFRLSRQAEAESDLDRLAEDFARVKVSSFVSDAAMDKLFKLFVRRSDVILRLIQNGEIRDSYSKSIRPLLVSKLLPIRCAVLVKEEDPARGHLYRRLEGLETVPVEYFNLPADGSKQLLRTETYVRLKDIKEHFLETHGRTAASQRLLQNCSLSVDGVKESNKGSRSFIFVTLRIGSCLYLVRSFNPLIGVADSKPTPKEILRQV